MRERSRSLIRRDADPIRQFDPSLTTGSSSIMETRAVPASSLPDAVGIRRGFPPRSDGVILVVDRNEGGGMAADTQLDARVVHDERPGPLPRFLWPLVDKVAKVRATVHTKLLAGFLLIALVLLAMGILSVVVVSRLNSQVETLTALNRQASQARDMIYSITAQVHYRAMSLLLEGADPSYMTKLDIAKQDLAADLEEIRTYAAPSTLPLLDRV